MDEYKEQLLILSEKIGKMMISVNEAMEKFTQTDAFKRIVDFLTSIPEDIQETELFHHIILMEKAEITYKEIEWIRDVFGYSTYELNIQTLRNKKKKTDVDRYVLEVIESEGMKPREKIIVLLAHFEELVFQTVSYERKSRDTVKRVISCNSKELHDMEWESYKKILLAGIVFIVFSNTDSYCNNIDMRIPFRNNILHRGTIAYSDNEIDEAYDILIFFIAELSKME